MSCGVIFYVFADACHHLIDISEVTVSVWEEVCQDGVYMESELVRRTTVERVLCVNMVHLGKIL